ncbi:MAG TPA: hypothetical protein VFQ61_22850 [Polyangiaceae bacterium]|nr:hypothetical protein [Polyangiaceae bacterium]
MASDRTPAGPRAARGLSRSGKHFTAAAVVAILVFGVFLAYAFLARATYQSTAQFVVEPASPAATPALPAPLEAARRVHEAVLGPEQMQRLARELSPHGGVEVRMLRDAFEVDTLDGRTFAVSFGDSEPERAQRLCSMLVHQAVGVAPLALATRSEEERSGETEREQRLAALMAFLSKHPEVTAGDKEGAAGKPEDAGLSALRIERERLSRRLQALESNSDNPYTDPSDLNWKPDAIRRRIAEIDGVVASRHRAIGERKADATQAPPAMVDEWRRLVQALSDAPPAIEPSTALKARLLSDATLPGWPVAPNRKLILLIGVLAGLGAFGIILVARGGSSRRSSSGPSTRRSSELKSTAEAKSSSSDAPAGLGPMAATGLQALAGAAPGSSSPPGPEGASAALPGVAAGASPALTLGIELPSVDSPALAFKVTQPFAPFLPGGAQQPGGGRPEASNIDGVAPVQTLVLEPAPGPIPPPEKTPIVATEARVLSPADGAASFPARPSPTNSAGTETLMGPSAVPPPRQTQPSILPHAVIEINAQNQRAADPRRAEAAPQGQAIPQAQAVPQAQAAPGQVPTAQATPAAAQSFPENREGGAQPAQPTRPPARVTQVLGSPMQALLSELGAEVRPGAGPARADAPRAERTSVPAEMLGGSGYRMSGAAAREDHAPKPHTAPSDGAAYGQPHGGSSGAPRGRASYTPPGGYAAGASYGAPPGRSGAAAPRVRLLVQDISSMFEPDSALSYESRSDLTAKVLSFGRAGQCFVTGISAAHDSSDAKSRLAVELALALAHQGRRTLLIEGDFQRPSVHRLLRVNPTVSTGFSQQLHQRMRNQSLGQWTVVRCSRTLDVLPEGVMRSPGLMASPQFIGCLAELREHYEFILIDGPPLSAEAECRILNSVAEGMVVVSAVASPAVLERASQLFPEKPFSAIVAAA